MGLPIRDTKAFPNLLGKDQKHPTPGRSLGIFLHWKYLSSLSTGTWLTGKLFWWHSRDPAHECPWGWVGEAAEFPPLDKSPGEFVLTQA